MRRQGLTVFAAILLTAHGVVAGAPATGASTAVVVLTADAATFDLGRGIYELVGHARATRRTTGAFAAGEESAESSGVLTSEKMLYQHKTRFLRATGGVVFEDSRYCVKSGVLEYDVGREWISAREGPTARIIGAGSAPGPGGPSAGGEGATTISALVLSYDRMRQRVVAEGQVRTTVRPADRAGHTVTSQELESYVADGRSVFKGDVKIDSLTLGARGDRAVFYERAERLYLFGRAQAWQVDGDGKAGRIVEGEQILHNLKTGRTVALRGVVLREREAGRLGVRPGASRPRARAGRRTLRLR
ncbi:MAG: hypothetical protein HYY25_15200 [Candidatus Wallbacteria bacterium]|nr:hypothetical protein [Candidatus Wallbacteria bacterium]